jgi:hypothetical protein
MITLTMVSAMAPINAFATENTKTIDANTSSNSTDVKYSVDPSYTVVIPASITLSDTAATSASISVDETAKPFKLAKGQKLSVKIANEDTNDFKVTNADDSLDYTVTAGSETLAKGSTAAEFSNDDKTDKTLTFSKMDASEAKYAGDYKGTLTFGISVEETATTIGIGTVFKIGETVDMGEYYYWNDKYQNEGSLFWNAKTATVEYFEADGTDGYMLYVKSNTMENLYVETTKTIYINVGDGHTVNDEPTGLVIVSGSGTQNSPFVLGAYYG